MQQGKINLVAWKKYKNTAPRSPYLTSRSDSEKICRIPVKKYKNIYLMMHYHRPQTKIPTDTEAMLFPVSLVSYPLWRAVHSHRQ